jgi:copper homeostasis protein (lipoprotein)
MKTNIISFFAILLIVVSCGPSQKITNSWVSPEAAGGVSYQKVFVAALSNDKAAKVFVENAIADKLSEMGVKTVVSSDLFPPNFSDYAEVGKEEMMKKIIETGADAIFTVALLDVQTTERYNPGTPYTPGYPGFGFYGSWGGYYNYRFPVIYSPGYYTTDKTYLIESNLYDAATEKLVWTVQSSAFSPANLNDWFRGYSRMMLMQMKKDGLLKPSDQAASATPADMHTSQIALDWQGNYYGILPCASCEGIETELTLRDDLTFTLSSKYLGESGGPIIFDGNFAWQGNNIALSGENQREKPALYKVEENRLRKLGMDGNIIDGELAGNYILTKTGNVMVENKRWVLKELNGQQMKENPETHYLIFHSDENCIEAKVGCNLLLHSYRITDGYSVKFTPGITTMMACPKSSPEPAFLEMLKTADNLSVTDEQLTLNKGRMAPLAKFRIAAR